MIECRGIGSKLSCALSFPCAQHTLIVVYTQEGNAPAPSLNILNMLTWT